MQVDRLKRKVAGYQTTHSTAIEKTVRFTFDGNRSDSPMEFIMKYEREMERIENSLTRLEK